MHERIRYPAERPYIQIEPDRLLPASQPSPGGGSYRALFAVPRELAFLIHTSIGLKPRQSQPTCSARFGKNFRPVQTETLDHLQRFATIPTGSFPYSGVMLHEPPYPGRSLGLLPRGNWLLCLSSA